MVLQPGESCTYPGTSDPLTINPDGTASFLFLTSGSSINITAGNISLQAARQGDGSWRIGRVGASGGGSGGDVGLAPATQAEFEARVVGKQIAQGAFSLTFIGSGRIREIDEGLTYEGEYEYRRTGSNSGMIVYTYDVTGNDPDRERSEVRFTFRTETTGDFESSYFEGGTRTGSVSGSFELVTAPTGSANRAPRAVGTIADQTLTEDGNATTVNVSAHFSDPDGDTLSYRATSSRTSVVRVSVSGSRVTLTPRDAGTATVTVTAADPDGLSASSRFTVMVNASGGGGGQATFRQGDRIPGFPTGVPGVVSGGSFSLSGGVVTITLNRDGYVEYPEHRYTCDASECGIRDGLVTDGVIVRTATGGSGGGGGTSNRAPRAVGTIADQTLTEDGNATTVNVSAYFSDPDGDTLSYRATSSRTSVVRVSVSGSRVTLTPRDAGTATVTVTAADPDGQSATQRFTARVESAEPQAGGTCTVGLLLRPGESCTYPGTSDELTVNENGSATFLFFTSGQSLNVINTTINGRVYTLVASRQSDGRWRIERVG